MSKFRLVSQFKLAGDQPKAIKQLSDNIQSGIKDQVLLGVTGSGKTYTIAKTIEKVQKPTLVIAHNKTLAAQLASEFRQFFPRNAVEYFVSYYDYYQPEAYLPTTDVYIEKDLEINEEIDRLRHAATGALLSREDVIIVASVSCIYGLGSPDFYKEITFQINKNEKIERDSLIRELVGLQYERNETSKRGTFRVKGEVFEIVRPDREVIIRIELEDGQVRKIFEYDNMTGEVISEDLKSVFVFPAKHFVAPQPIIEEAIDQIKAEMKARVQYFNKNNKIVEAERIERRVNHDMEMLQEIGYCNGIENYSVYLSDRERGSAPHTLIDYFPEDFLTVIDESHVTVPQIGAMYRGDRARKENLINYGFRLPSAFDNRPLRFEEFEKRMNQVIYLSATPAEYELKKAGNEVVEQIVRPTGLVDPQVEVRPCFNQVKDVIIEIKKVTKQKERTLITTLTKKMAEDLAEYLKEEDEIKTTYLHSEVDTVERIKILEQLRRGEIDVLVGVNLLREGLDLPEVSLVAILDADKEGFLRSRTSLIQTIGRAARNVRGRVILYADQITGSMKAAIDETKRRRKLQEDYNKKHGITPKSVEKKLKSIMEFESKEEKSAFSREKIVFKNQKELEKHIKNLEKEMKNAAKQLEFEKAAVIRDEIVVLKRGRAKT
ncbi:MAG TPA: excinuclease ABC subunit UvrB [Candidatus Moranbacteria bacterium]|nr:excinuclease ABC subunit UvrB [Candidatus Moranbacteria bacterium]